MMMNSEYSSVEFEDFEEEVTNVSPKDFSKAVLYSIDWTVETIFTQLKKGNIILNPAFQRRDAWFPNRKSKFIESIILGLPIPQIVLAEHKEEKGKFLVLDGKQRLLTLFQFIGGDKGKYNSFRLSDLEIRRELNGFSFIELNNSPLFRQDIDSFLNQTIRTVVIRNWPNSDFLHTVFYRLNTGSVQLSPQELRQALIPGPFVDYINEAVISCIGLQSLLKIKEPDFRMRDNELLVRYIAFNNFFPSYKGDLKRFLDDTCRDLNTNWSHEEPNIRNNVDKLENAIEFAIQIFSENYIGRKWTENGYESRLNKAILDILLFYFSSQSIRDASRLYMRDIEERFKFLCLNNNDFRTSIETTTKSMGATFTRFSIWGTNLKSIIGIDFPIPEFNNSKFSFTGFKD